jgi:hypothetical protein
MAAELIVGPLGDAEQLALYPERYPDLAELSVEERIRYLFRQWFGTDEQRERGISTLC